jgi:hypothetical protein
MAILIERQPGWPAALHEAVESYERAMADVLIVPKKNSEDWESQVFLDRIKRVQVARDRFVALRKAQHGHRAMPTNRMAQPLRQRD